MADGNLKEEKIQNGEDPTNIITIEAPYRDAILCKYCGRKFTIIQNLKRHIKNQHLGFRYSCLTCSSEVTRREDIIRHYLSFHPNKMEEAYGIREVCKKTEDGKMKPMRRASRQSSHLEGSLRIKKSRREEEAKPILRPDSDIGVRPRPDSGLGVGPRPDSGLGVRLKPDSILGVRPRPDSGLGVRPRPDSELGVRLKPDSNLGVRPRPGLDLGVGPRPGSEEPKTSPEFRNQDVISTESVPTTTTESLGRNLGPDNQRVVIALDPVTQFRLERVVSERVDRVTEKSVVETLNKSGRVIRRETIEREYFLKN